MKIKKIYIDGKVSQGVYFDEKDLKKIKQIYANWVELNEIILSLEGRALNVPDIVSEGLFCYLFNVLRVNSKSNSKSYDAFDDKNNLGIQVKSCSIENDCTSFGPNSTWDKIYFMRFFPENKDGRVEIFDVSSYNFKKLILNKKKNETFEDQQKQGRRPRFSIQKEIIKRYNVKPIKVIKLLED